MMFTPGELIITPSKEKENKFTPIIVKESGNIQYENDEYTAVKDMISAFAGSIGKKENDDYVVAIKNDIELGRELMMKQNRRLTDLYKTQKNLNADFDNLKVGP